MKRIMFDLLTRWWMRKCTRKAVRALRWCLHCRGITWFLDACIEAVEDYQEASLGAPSRESTDDPWAVSHALEVERLRLWLIELYVDHKGDGIREIGPSG